MPGTITLQGPKSDDIAIVEDGSEAHGVFTERGWKLLVASKPSVESGDTKEPGSTLRKIRGGKL